MTGRDRYRLAGLAVCLGLFLAPVGVAALGSPIQQLTDDAAADVRPAWSPDGRLIAFQSNRTGRFQIYLVHADGSNERLLSSPSDGDDRHPAWRPDGKAISVDSGSGNSREIWTIDVESGARTQVTRLGANASFPGWSPGGDRVGFFVYRSGNMEIWSVKADGSEPRQLTYGLASELRNQCTFACHAVGWSPDGQRIAYSSGDQDHVWTMRASDGGDPVRVSPDRLGGRSHFPTYLPDGRLVFVTEHVTPGQSWTDVWSVGPDGILPAEPLVADVQAQGPFELSPDGGRLLFSSPRSGHFDIYAVPLTSEGKDALKTKSAAAEPAPGLLVRRAGATATPRIAEAVAAPAPAVEARGGVSGYLVAAGGAAAAVAAGWLLLIARLRRDVRREEEDGRPNGS